MSEQPFISTFVAFVQPSNSHRFAAAQLPQIKRRPSPTPSPVNQRRHSSPVPKSFSLSVKSILSNNRNRYGRTEGKPQQEEGAADGAFWRAWS
jgi:hypothetical protein